MSKVLDRILSDYRSHLFEQKPELQRLIGHLKMDLWHGPIQAGEDYPGWSEGVDRLREMMDDGGELWVNLDTEEWATQRPDNEPDDPSDDLLDDLGDWLVVSTSSVWRSILGELYEYV